MPATRTTHGMRNTPLYGVWCTMRRRCSDPEVKSYPDYGGRGIKVCERWKAFAAFYEDMGQRPSPKHELDRYPDNNGNYEPGNVRWALRAEQVKNKRNNRVLTALGKTQTLMEWARELGVSHTAILYRLRAGWSVEAAVTQPAEDRPNSKLSIEQAQWALDNYPAMSLVKIGVQLGVSDTSILNIIKGRTYASLTRSGAAQAAAA